MKYYKILSNPNYLINKRGDIFSLYTNRLRSIKQNQSGYYVVILDKKTKMIHRLLAETFIPNPMNYPEVNHIDGNKTNNSISNLEWCTRKQNIQHAIKLGLLNVGEKNPNSKFTRKQINKIRKLSLSGISDIKLAKMFNTSRSYIWYIKNNKAWNHTF